MICTATHVGQLPLWMICTATHIGQLPPLMICATTHIDQLPLWMSFATKTDQLQLRKGEQRHSCLPSILLLADPYADCKKQTKLRFLIFYLFLILIT